jgi:hypothetical protein
MSRCLSCKNRGTNEQCPNKPLSGLTVCGIHARTKRPRLWTDVNGIKENALKIWRVWSGYIVRKQLKNAGDGVLKRTACHNTDELVSMDPIKDVHPFDYFGFEENGKVYGFDVRTMIDIMIRNRNPSNPYTRQPLSVDTRRRLRWLYQYRIRQKLECQYESSRLTGMDVILTSRWNQICQVLEENGFIDLTANTFLILNKTQLYIFLKFLQADLNGWVAEHIGKDSRRTKYLRWVDYTLHKIAVTHTVQECMILATSLLRGILYDCTDPYNVCFFIMSALYRL